MKTITIDIGGTFVKWAVIDENYKIIEKDKFETNALYIKGKGIMELIANCIKELRERYDDIDCVGISVPGAVDSNTSEILAATKNIPESQGLNIRKEINKHININIEVINDANAAALGEKVNGELNGVDTGVFITLGTGIGAGIIIGGEIYEGFRFSAGEVGRHYIDQGTWETFSSVRGLTNSFHLMFGRNFSGEECFEYGKENEIAINYIDKWYRSVSLGIANIIYILNPEKVIIGGGISTDDSLSLEQINKHLKNIVSIEILENTVIKKSSSGNDAALYGLAYLCKSRRNKEDI